LKKQSQFAPAQVGAKSFMKGDYDNIAAGGVKKNKAKQSQTKPISVSAGRFIIYNHLETGCQMLDARWVSRIENQESRIKNRESRKREYD